MADVKKSSRFQLKQADSVNEVSLFSLYTNRHMYRITAYPANSSVQHRSTCYH